MTAAVPNEIQLKLLRLLRDNDGLYDFDEQLDPFHDSTGGEPNKPDIIMECWEMGWVDGEECNHQDLFYLTGEGRKFADAVDSSSTDRGDK